MDYRRSFFKLNLYIGKEYILSFVISFIFFFFIFFINQILVLAQKIMLKNVEVSDILILVTLAIPQFLMYTMPFSSLSSASMVIGNLSSQNEIIAMRSNGIHTRRIFLPIVFISVFISVMTLMIADKLIPYTALQYRQLYAKLIQNTPTLELESYSSTQFGNRIISNGKVDGNKIFDVIIFDNNDSTDSRVITADSAEISVLDIDNFLYKIDLENPEIFISDNTSLETFSIAKASHLTLNIDLSSSNSGYTAINPSQMSLSELKNRISEKEIEQEELIKNYFVNLCSEYASLANSTEEFENRNGGDISTVRDLSFYMNNIKSLKRNKAYSFYYQYYRSEFQKKLALSVACTCLVFLAFPLSFVKVKYGRLFGFGLSMFFACMYWFFLYYMHLTSVSTPNNPFFYMWLPNAVIMIIGLTLLKKLSRN